MTIMPAHASLGLSMRRARASLDVPITREWAFGAGDGAGVRICVIDSGVDTTHPAVGPGTAAYRVTSGADGHEVVPDDVGDQAGHGTACAGIIRTMAPACELTSVRMLGGALRGRGDTLVAALHWALDRGFQVVNLSLSTRSPEYRDAIREVADRAYFTGTTIVAAAHNRPVPSFPWCFPSVISAGAHSVDDPERIEANPAPPVEFFALGVDVTVARPGGGMVRVSGNSFAAPHLTGMCARILGTHPEFTTPQLKVILTAIANNLI